MEKPKYKKNRNWLKIRYDALSIRDKQYVLMNALKASSTVMEGSKLTKEELVDYTDFLIESFYILEEGKRPGYGDMPIPVKDKKVDKFVKDLK